MIAKRISISNMEAKCEWVSGLLKALSHPGRLLILGHLCQGQRTVSELQDLCHISQSQVSQFLTRMKLEGLVKCERNGRHQAYQITDEKTVQLIQAIHSIYC